LGATIALALSVFAAGANAAPCRDSHGKFIKCPPMVKHCRDIKTKRYAKCGGPHTEPAPMAPMH
jgi:hypothetical protein